MPATSLGFPYPALTDPPNGPDGISQLAAAVNTYLSDRRQARLVARTTTQTITSGINPVGVYDGGSLYNVGAITYGGGLLTAGVAGLYRWAGTVSFPTDSSTSRVEVLVLKNGAVQQVGANDMQLLPSNTSNVSAGGPIVLAAGDTLQMGTFYGGSSLAGVTPLYFSIVRIA